MPTYRITIETGEQTSPPFEMDLDKSLPVREVIRLLLNHPELDRARSDPTPRSYHLLGGSGRSYLSSEQQLGQTPVAGGGDLVLVQEQAPWRTESATVSLQGSPIPPPQHIPPPDAASTQALRIPTSPPPDLTSPPPSRWMPIVLGIGGVLGGLALLVGLILWVLDVPPFGGETNGSASISQPQQPVFLIEQQTPTTNPEREATATIQLQEQTSTATIQPTSVLMPTSTLIPTSTPIPSNTPIPTDIPAPATSTPLPLPTPVPTRVPAPTEPPPPPPPPTEPPPPQLVTVPSVVGSAVDGARAALANAGLVAADNVTTGCGNMYTVISQSPGGGAQVNPGTAVVISYCKGVAVPNVIGMNQGAAASTLHAQGLGVSVVETPDLNQPDGQVWSSSPGPGAYVNQGTTVTIYAYKHVRHGGGDDGGGGGGGNAD